MRAAILSGLLLCAHSRAGDDADSGYRTLLERLAGKWDVPCATLTVVRGEAVSFFAKGTARGGTPVDAGTLFGIGSVSKGLTATLVASYVADGRIRWHDSVAHLGPDVVLGDENLARRTTLLDCLCHRTGIPSNDFLWYADPGLDRRALIEDFARAAQGARHGALSYNHMAYVLAAAGIERFTSKPWDRELTDRVLVPLGMSRTFVDPRAALGPANGTDPHTLVGGQMRRVSTQSPDALAPALGMVSCSRDLTRWALWLMGRGGMVVGRLRATTLLCSPERLGATDWLPTDVDEAEHGVGCYLDTYNGLSVAVFGDDGIGWTGLVGLIPDKNLAVVILSNVGSADFAWSLWYKVADTVVPDIGLGERADILLEASITDRQALAALEVDVGDTTEDAATPWGRYEGVYLCKGLPKLVLKANGNGLGLSIGELRGQVRREGRRFSVKWEQDYVGRGMLRATVAGQGPAASVELKTPEWPWFTFERVK